MPKIFPIFLEDVHLLTKSVRDKIRKELGDENHNIFRQNCRKKMLGGFPHIKKLI